MWVVDRVVVGKMVESRILMDTLRMIAQLGETPERFGKIRFLVIVMPGQLAGHKSIRRSQNVLKMTGAAVSLGITASGRSNLKRFYT